MTRDDSRKRRLARAVRTHDGMYLSITYGQVDAFEYFFLANVGVQIFNF